MIFFPMLTEYFTERDDYEDDEEDEDGYDYELDESDGLCSSSIEESGLGLLGPLRRQRYPEPRCHQSALHCPTGG